MSSPLVCPKASTSLKSKFENFTSLFTLCVTPYPVVAISATAKMLLKIIFFHKMFVLIIN